MIGMVLGLVAGLHSDFARAAGAVGPLHSHNDYSHRKPLRLALQNGFESVEADIWKIGNQLKVGHFPPLFRGTLGELYLFPLLMETFRNGGSVYGDGKTFYLWIEFKDNNPETVEMLARELEQLPIFTEFTDEGIRWNAVTVILTGKEKNMERLVNRPGRRFATMDSGWISASDPSTSEAGGNRWLWYSLNWKEHVGWDGRGEMPYRQYLELRRILHEAHSRGRRVRFYSTPERPAFWELARSEGIDLVGTDRLRELSRFWAGAP